jgi:hypothetical protein
MVVYPHDPTLMVLTAKLLKGAFLLNKFHVLLHLLALPSPLFETHPRRALLPTNGRILIGINGFIARYP